MMKKLSLLVAICLLVTVGGVYATWNYAQGQVVTRNDYLDGETKITDKVVTTAKGIISIDTTGASIVIDDANNDFYGELTVEGKVKVTFTPNDGADETIRDNGIRIKYNLSQLDTWLYNGTPIFTLDTEEHELIMPADPAADGSFSAEIDLSGMITLNPLYLPTVSDYDKFKNVLHNGSIQITVSELTA